MTAMVNKSCAAGEWTLAYENSSGGAVNVAIQNLSNDAVLRVRVGSGVDESDSLDDPYGLIMTTSWLTLTGVAAGDKVLLAPHRRTGSEDLSAVKAVVWV